MKEEIKPTEIFEIKVEATVPCSMTFRVRASTPEEALKLMEKQHPISFQPIVSRRKFVSAKVFTPGTIMLRANKTYR